MWLLSIVFGVVLLVLGLARSYTRVVVMLLIATLAGGVVLAMMNEADAGRYALRSMVVAW